MKDYMKRMLCDGLYDLMQKKSFEKITIKQICDEVGVIRGTFYNHFMDKYEALEYLTKELLFSDFNKENNSHTIFTHIISIIDEHQSFFERAFLIQGQNNFEDMLQNIFKEIFSQMMRGMEINFQKQPFDHLYLASFYAASLKFVVKEWVSHGCQTSCDEMSQRIEILIANNLTQLLEKR